MVACKDQCEDPVCPPDGPDVTSDYEVKLARRDQVLCFYKYMSPFNTLLISGDPEPQGGKQEAGADHQRPVQQ